MAIFNSYVSLPEGTLIPISSSFQGKTLWHHPSFRAALWSLELLGANGSGPSGRPMVSPLGITLAIVRTGYWYPKISWVMNSLFHPRMCLCAGESSFSSLKTVTFPSKAPLNIIKTAIFPMKSAIFHHKKQSFSPWNQPFFQVAPGSEVEFRRQTSLCLRTNRSLLAAGGLRAYLGRWIETIGLTGVYIHVTCICCVYIYILCIYYIYNILYYIVLYIICILYIHILYYVVIYIISILYMYCIILYFILHVYYICYMLYII